MKIGRDIDWSFASQANIIEFKRIQCSVINNWNFHVVS